MIFKLPFIRPKYPSQYEWVMFPDESLQILCKDSLINFCPADKDKITGLWLSKSAFKGAKRIQVKRIPGNSLTGWRLYRFSSNTHKFHRTFGSTWWDSFATDSFNLFIKLEISNA